MSKIKKWVDSLYMQVTGWVLYGWCTLCCTRLLVLPKQSIPLWHRTCNVH